MALEEKKILYKLSELDYYEVSDKDPDVRGWEVYTLDRKRAGTVDDLIIDPGLMKVRYLDVLLDFYMEGGREILKHILVPIGIASVDKKEDFVRLPGLTLEALSLYPPFEGGIVTRKYEHSLRKIIEPDIMFTSDDSGDFYSHNHFDEDMFYSDRRTRSGL